MANFQRRRTHKAVGRSCKWYCKTEKTMQIPKASDRRRLIASGMKDRLANRSAW